MGVDEGKLLYRGWLSVLQVDNGLPLYASSPTGNGELVYQKEYHYCFSVSSPLPSYNSPYYECNYDGTGFAHYSSDINGQMFATSSLLSVNLGTGIPSKGEIPSNNAIVSGLFQTGQIHYEDPGTPEDTDTWDAVVVPFMKAGSYINPIDVDTGKKLFIFSPTIEIFTFTYPSEKDIQAGTSRPEDPQTHTPLTFAQVVNVIRNWGYSEWNGSQWTEFRTLREFRCFGYNWRKKGYGTTMPMNAATLNWVVHQGLLTQGLANEYMLQNQGTYEIFIVK